MKYYARYVINRVEINRFRKLGYRKQLETLKTNNIDKFNKGKKIRFTETTNTEIIKELRHLDVDKVYTEDAD